MTVPAKTIGTTMAAVAAIATGTTETQKAASAATTTTANNNDEDDAPTTKVPTIPDITKAKGEQDVLLFTLLIRQRNMARKGYFQTASAI